MKAGILLLSLLWLWSCGDPSTAGAVIDTSTLNAEVQGRSVSRLSGQWFIVKDSSGHVDSVQVSDEGLIDVLYTPSQSSIALQTDSLSYFAYRILSTDTIRPSAPLRYLFPAYVTWDSLHSPWIVGHESLQWNSTHGVWFAEDLAPGRYWVQWIENGDTLATDLVIHEMANRYELHQMSASINSGSIRPVDCGFQDWNSASLQWAGLGCPHTESDGFNRNGLSTADLRVWSDTLLNFQIITLSNLGVTVNPYSKMLLEFGPNEEAFDVSDYDTLVLHMDLPMGDSLHVRLAQKDQNVARWYTATLVGLGDQEYAIALDSTRLSVNYVNALPLDLAQIFGLEFRNSWPGRVVDAKLKRVGWR